MNQFQCEAPGEQPGDVVLKGTQVEAMRRVVHELANILTGITIGAGLLCESLEEGKLRQSASGMCADCERGRQLVWELHRELPASAELQEAIDAPDGGTAENAGAPEAAEESGEQTKSVSASAGESGVDRKGRQG